jgi:surface antigen
MNSLKGSLLVAAGAVATIAATQGVASADTTYSVKSGDTLYSIANTHSSSVDAIVKANGLSNANLILTGQSLNIPGADSSATTDSNTSSDTSNTASGSYTVVSGDTLYGIATNNGMTLASLVQLNNLDASQIIYPVQVLQLSSTGNGSATGSTTDTNSSTNTNTNNNQNNTVVDSTNTYPYGQCTWYVKSQLSWVGNWWGNAADWTSSARAAGHSVSATPTVGAVAYFAPGVQGADSTYGHVAVVDSVNANGTVNISEANYLGLIYHTRTISTSGVLFIQK